MCVCSARNTTNFKTAINSIIKSHLEEWTFCIVSEGFINNSLVRGIGLYIL